MTHTRRPISLVVSVVLGLGAALIVLLLRGGQLAAAAQAGAGDNRPAGGNICFARDDSATGTVYGSGDAGALRQAVAHAVPNDIVRLAGTCHGAVAQLGTTQTVAITKALNLVGGFTPANWNNTFPITQPTILDAQGLGRVITASASITLSDLTIQNGDSFGHAGGGIFARVNLTLFGTVNILRNTALVSTTFNSPAASILSPSQDEEPYGGGAFVEDQASAAAAGGDIGPVGGDATPVQVAAGDVMIASNSALDGGGMYAGSYKDLTAILIAKTPLSFYLKNSAQQFGGGLFVLNDMIAANILFANNHTPHFGAGFDVNGPATITNLECQDNNAGGGGCGASAGFSLTINQCSMANDTAIDGAGLDVFDAITLISRCSATNEQATNAGGFIYATDAPLNMFDNLFRGNTAPQGGVLFAERFVAPDPPVARLSLVTADYFTLIVPPHQLLAPSTAPTGSAFFASGVTLFITDTIVSGYSLDLETATAPSSTIHGDYNLFDHTPVISGTNITTGTHSLVGNPLFADAAGHLSAGSPAIDHGIDVGVNVDLDGNPRPSGAGFDIGAYEFQVALEKLFLPLVQR